MLLTPAPVVPYVHSLPSSVSHNRYGSELGTQATDKVVMVVGEEHWNAFIDPVELHCLVWERVRALNPPHVHPTSAGSSLARHRVRPEVGPPSRNRAAQDARSRFRLEPLDQSTGRIGLRAGCLFQALPPRPPPPSPTTLHTLSILTSEHPPLDSELAPLSFAHEECAQPFLTRCALAIRSVTTTYRPHSLTFLTLSNPPVVQVSVGEP